MKSFGTPESADRSAKTLWVGRLAVAALLFWRAATQPASFLWRDWVVVLGLYLFLRGLELPTQVRSRLSLYFILYLLGIYVAAQGPWTVRSWIGTP